MSGYLNQLKYLGKKVYWAKFNNCTCQKTPQKNCQQDVFSLDSTIPVDSLGNFLKSIYPNI